MSTVNERTHLLAQQSPASSRSNSTSAPSGNAPECQLGEIDDDDMKEKKVVVDRGAIACLCLQHISSDFGNQIYSFAGFMFLVEIFKETLAPASLTGLASTACGLLFSGYVGSIVDRTARLKYVRGSIIMQKSLQLINYSLYLVLLGPLAGTASAAFRGDAPPSDILMTYSLLGLIVGTIALGNLYNTGMQVAIERDWVTTISRGDGAVLSQLNTYMRIITVCSRACPPMILSFFVVPFGYRVTTIILMVASGLTLFIEFWWIQVVYNRFPILRIEEEARQEAKLRDLSEPAETEPLLISAERDEKVPSVYKRVVNALKNDAGAWREFAQMPIFYGALADSVKWVETLSMDGVGMSYFKISRGWDEGHLALIRAGCLVSSLSGALAMRPMERTFGTSRTALMSMTSSAIMVCVAVVAFFLDPGRGPSSSGIPTWNSAMMLSGIILARSGQGIFSLVFIKQLQLSLGSHPQRNRLTALKAALNKGFSLLKYMMVFILSKPEQFKWTTAATLCSSWCCVILYCVYIVKKRNA